MKYAEYPLFAEGFINRFITTGIFAKEQQFTKATLNGRINEWLKRGFAIHENPCRGEFTQERREILPEQLDLSASKSGDEVTVFEQRNSLQIYFPFGNVGVDWSGFYYNPTYLRSYHHAMIHAGQAQQGEFELSTCGGMTLWVNGELITDFTPFTRNMIKSTTVIVPLQAGMNNFTICLDDLAERDTDYYFRIRRIGQMPLKIFLPVDENANLAELAAMEQMLEHTFFEKEAYISEPVKLQIDNACWRPLDLSVTISPGEFIEKMENQKELYLTKTYRLEQDQRSIVLLHADEIRPGYYYFTVRIQSGGIILYRKIGNQLVRREFLEYMDEGLAERKAHAAKIVLQYGVDNVYKAAVLFKCGQEYERAEQIIMSEIDGVRKRKDCSDFHFTIILYIYRSFYAVLSDKLKSRIELEMRRYRYWIDEPGDDVMWFFSENHALLFHICQYLAGGSLPEQIFTNSKMTGRQLEQKAVGLLDDWFAAFFKEFITEWNSSAYIPVDVLGIGTLYNLTPQDSELHQKAKKALDMIFYSLCINEHKGAVMTSFGRTYEKELKGNYNAGTTGLLYVTYNAGYLNRAVIGYLPLILGDYQAPPEYRKYLGLTDDTELTFQNTQGFEQHVNLYLYKNADTALSTAVGFAPYKKGYQEHIVQASIDELAQVFINHPGESQPYGSGRPNFWAGNGSLPMAMQYRDMAVIKYDIPEEQRIDYTHAYIPLSEFHKYRGDSHTIVLEKDGGYIGVKALNGFTIQQSGPCRHREFLSRGRRNIWVVKVARSCDYDNLEAFFKEFEKYQLDLGADGEVSVSAPNRSTYRIDSNDVCYVDGRQIYQYPLTVAGIVEIKGENIC